MEERATRRIQQCTRSKYWPISANAAEVFIANQIAGKLKWFFNF
jgi:hypothetical protein